VHFPSSPDLALRRTVEEDLDFVVAAENHPENRPYVFQWSRERHRAALANGDLRHLVLDALPERRPVGYAILAGIQNAHRSVELMRIVVTEKRRGYGREGVRLIQELAFDFLGAHRLWLDMRTYNDQARELYRSTGFVEEGILRDCVLVDGVFYSNVIMSMLEGEYRRLSKK